MAIVSAWSRLSESASSSRLTLNWKLRERGVISTALKVGSLVAKLVDDPAQAPVRAGLISSQILGLALCRYALRLPPVADLTADQVVAWLGPTVQRYLFA